MLPARLPMPPGAAATAPPAGITMEAVMDIVSLREDSGATMDTMLTAKANTAARRPPVVAAGMRGLNRAFRGGRGGSRRPPPPRPPPPLVEASEEVLVSRLLTRLLWRLLRMPCPRSP
jgi:hypothetical protein